MPPRRSLAGAIRRALDSASRLFDEDAQRHEPPARPAPPPPPPPRRQPAPPQRVLLVNTVAIPLPWASLCTSGTIMIPMAESITDPAVLAQMGLPMMLPQSVPPVPDPEPEPTASNSPIEALLPQRWTVEDSCPKRRIILDD